MNLRTNRLQLQGNVLIVTLLTPIVVSIALASYMLLVSNENRTTMRTLAWTSCIPTLEAGVEEALTQIYYNGITNLAANGWVSANGVFTKERTIGDSYYTVSIEPVDPPVIYSTGYARAPMTRPAQLGMLMGTNPSHYARRKVRVLTQKARSGGGLTDRGSITFRAGGSLDSFDSSDSKFSTNGKYDPAKRRAGGKAATNSNASDAIHAVSVHIYGTVATGPGGTVTVGSGAVGDVAWNASQFGIQTDH